MGRRMVKKVSSILIFGLKMGSIILKLSYLPLLPLFHSIFPYCSILTYFSQLSLFLFLKKTLSPIHYLQFHLISYLLLHILTFCLYSPPSSTSSFISLPLLVYLFNLILILFIYIIIK